MVAIFVGQGAGFTRGSANLLGGAGLLGSGSFGRGAENVSVNAATGGLLIRQQDEFLTGKGLDISIGRTYNSIGDVSGGDGDNGDNWQQSTMRRVFGLTGTQNTAGSTIKRQGADGAVVTYTWNATRSAYLSTDGEGAHDELKKVGATWVWTEGSSRFTDTYNAYGTDNWRITAATDKEYFGLTFTYVGDKLDKVTTATAGGGDWTQYVWSGNKITQVVTGYTDLATSTAKTLTRTRYAYDGSNRLYTVTIDLSPQDNYVGDNRTFVTTYTYDGSSTRVASISTTGGASIAIAYDGSNRVQTMTETVDTGLTRVTSFAYDATHTDVTGPDGKTTRLEYDASKRLTKLTLPAATGTGFGQFSEFEYDADGNVTKVTDTADKDTSYTYDASGNVLTTTDANSNVVTRTYSAKNELLTETRTIFDESGATINLTTRYAYDSASHLRYIISAEGFVTEYEWASANQYWTTEYPQQAYDISALASNQSITESQLTTWRTTFDNTRDKIISEQFDARGNMTKRIRYGKGATNWGNGSQFEGYSETFYAYDQAGRLLSQYDNGVLADVFVYDGMGRVVAASNAAAGLTTYRFDDANTTTIVHHADGLTRTKVYNKAGDLLSEMSATPGYQPDELFPDLNAWTKTGVTQAAATPIDGKPAYSYTLNATGSPGVIAKSMSVAAGETVPWRIAVKGSPTDVHRLGLHGSIATWGSITGSDASATVISGPGVAKNVGVYGTLFELSGLSTTQETIIEIRGTFAQAQAVYAYFYVGVGASVPAGTTVTLGANNLTRTVSDLDEAISSTTAYRYDALGRVRMITTPRGVATTSDANDHNSFILYNHAGQRTADIAADGSIVEYRYDAAGRLAATIAYATKLNSTQLVALTAAGGIAEVATYRPTGVAADVCNWNIYDAAGRLVQTIAGDGGVTNYSYDKAGRLITTIVYVNKVTVTAYKTTPPTAPVTPTPASGIDRVTRNFYDRDGRLVGALDGEGYLSEVVYDKAGQKVEEIGYSTRPTVNLLTSSFSALKSSAGTSVTSNRRVHYVYDGQGLLRYQVNGLGQVTSFAFDKAQQLTTTIVHAATISPADFTYASVKTAVTAIASDTNDRENFTIYNAEGQAAYTVDAAGRVVAFAYDVAGRVIKTLDFATLRATTDLESLATMDSWAASNAGHSDNRITRSYWNAAGELRFTIDAEGYVSRFAYDPDGNLVEEVRFATAISVTDATTIADVDTLATGSSISISHFYDMAGRRYATIDGETFQTRSEWDGAGNLVTTYEAYGAADQVRTDYTYDGAGRLISETRAAGASEASTVQYAYDGLGNRTSMTDPLGKITNWTYDEVGRVLTMVDAAGTTAYEYNGFGEVVKVTDPRGNASYSYYDSLGRLTLVRDAESYVTETIYTAFGQALSVTRRYNPTVSTPSTTVLPTVTANAAKDATTSYTYDKRGLVLTTTEAVTDTLNIVTTSTYDAFGQLKTVNRASATTSFDYDRRGMVTKATDAEGFFESYGYDAYGNRTSVVAKSSTTAKVAGGTTTYTYDKRGLLLTETLPVASYLAGGSVQASTITNKYSYDGRGNRKQMIEAFGLAEARTTSFTYDKLDRLTKTTHQSFQGLTPEDQIAYDAAGNIVRTIDAAGSRTVYFYDDLGRKRMSIDMAGTVSTFAYDANGNTTEARVYEIKLTIIPETGGPFVAVPTEVTSGNSRVTSFAYDKLNRLKTSDVAGVSGGSWNTGTSAWDAYSNAALTTTYAYDAFGNVVKTIEPNQHVGSVPVSNAAATWSYYDKLGRKTHQVDAAGYVTAWTYNAEGNVLTEMRYANAVAAPTGTQTPPSATANSAQDRLTSFTYDKNGNRLSEARADVLVHDGSGGTASVTATIYWRYNGLGQVVRRTEATGDTTKNVGELGDESTYYTYDVGGRLIEEKRASFVDYSTVSTPVIVTPEVDYHYNGLGDLVHTVAAGAGTVLQRETSYAYSGGKLLSVTDAEGFVRRYKYDVMGRVTHDYYTRIKSDGSNAYAYEGTLTQYDVLGRTAKQWQATSTDATTWTAASPVLSTLYTSYGEVWKTGLNAASVADVNRVWQTENIYDAAGRLRASNSGDAVWKYFAYDKVGNRTAAITNAGYAGFAGLSFADAQLLSAHATHGAKVNATYTVYDERNMAVAVLEEGRQLTASTTATIATSRTYNAFGEVATETNALNGVTTYSYNKAGRLLRREGPTVQVTHENGLTQWVRPSEDYYYDRSGRLVATRDANGEYASGGTLESSPVSKLANKGNLTQLTLLAGTGYAGGEALVTSEAYVDGGTKSVKYDIHGDARVTIDEVGRRREQLYDRLGRVTVVTHPGAVGQQLVERFAYDGLGQRIRHWNNQLNPLNTTTGLTGEIATTDYDVQGRVINVRAFGGDVTTTSYMWDAAISALAGVSLGGWSEVATMANGRTLSEKSDLYGRVTWKEDLGDHVTQYVYDVAGRQIESTTGGSKNVFTWYNSGQIATLANGSSNAGQVNSVWSRQTAVYGYDKMGNRVAETLSKELSEYQPAGMVWDGDGWIEVTEYYYVNVTPIKNQSATYDAMGRLKTWNEAGTNFSPIASTTHQYDANGNIRKTHTEFRMVDANGGYASNATVNDYWFAFDSRNRLVVDKGVLSGTAGAVGTTIVRGTTGTTIFYNVAGEREWAETSGVQISLAAWRRTAWGQNTYYHQREYEDDGSTWTAITLTQVGNRREKYEYDAAGRLSAIKQQDSEISFVDGDSSVGVGGLGLTKTRSLFEYDKMGRMKSQDDYNAAGTSIVFSRDLYYNDKGQLIEDDSSTTKTDGYTYRTITRNDYGTGAGYALGSLVQTQSDSYRNNNDGDFTDTATKYTFEWFDSAVQKTIKHDKSYGNNDDPNTYGMTQGATLSGFDDDTSSLSILNDFGQVIQAQITDGQSRNVYFTLDELGQVLRREETRPSTAPSVQTGAPNEIWYRFAGREMGYTGNNSSAADTNFEAIAERQAPSPNPYGTFRGGSTNAISYGDLTNSYDAITSFDQGSAGGSYTVRGGDTLSSIAQSLYGDAGLWYKIAEANGMSGNVPLVEGQALTLPTGVVRSTHNASTFKPYDPAEAIGDLSPTAPKPPKKPKCGVFGQILVAAIAIGLSVWLGPKAGVFFAKAFAGLGAAAGVAGGIVGGVLVGAGASIVSQGVGVAIGAQDSFSWKGVGLAAIGGAIGGATGADGLFGSDGLFGGGAFAAAGRAAVNSAVTQGIGVATGLQSKFDFAGVAAAGVGAGIAHHLGGTMGRGIGPSIAKHSASAIANAVTRTAISGGNFGDNLIAAIPDTIGQIIGDGIRGDFAGRKMVAAGGSMGMSLAGSSPVARGGMTSGDASEIMVTGQYDLIGLMEQESNLAAPYVSLAAIDSSYEEIVVSGSAHMQDHLKEMNAGQFVDYGSVMGNSTAGEYAHSVALWALSLGKPNPRRMAAITHNARIVASQISNNTPDWWDIGHYGNLASGWAGGKVDGWRQGYTGYSIRLHAAAPGFLKPAIEMADVVAGFGLTAGDIVASLPGAVTNPLDTFVGGTLAIGVTLADAAIIQNGQGDRMLSNAAAKFSAMSGTERRMFAGGVATVFAPGGALKLGRFGRAAGPVPEARILTQSHPDFIGPREFVGPIMSAAESIPIATRGGTYVLKDAGGIIVRSGRTNDFVRRKAEHGRDPALKSIISKKCTGLMFTRSSEDWNKYCTRCIIQV